MTYHSASGRPQEQPSPDAGALAKILMFAIGSAIIPCVTAKTLGPIGAMLGSVAARVIPRITTGSGQIMMITGAAVPTLVAEALKQLEQRLQALKNALMTPNAYFPYSIFADQIFKQIPDELPPLYDGPYPDTPDYLGEAYDSVADFLRGLGATLSETDKKPLEKPGSFRNGEIVGDAIIAILSLFSATVDEAAKYSSLTSAFGTYNSGGSGGLGGSSLSLDGSGALSAPSFVGGGLSIPYIDLWQQKALQSAYEAMSDIAKPQEATSSQSGGSNKPSKDDPYTGGRTQHELDELAKDPSHGNKMTNQGLKEREIGLELEKQGKLGRIIRDSQADKGAEFIDESTGIKWDVKSFESYPNGHTSPKKGAFDVNNAMKKINTEISNGHNVIIDTRNMVSEHISQLQKAIDAANIGNLIIWYP